MTYDVQRWDLPGPFFEAHMIEGGRWVLVEDALAHEKAAVKREFKDGIMLGFSVGVLVLAVINSIILAVKP